MSIAVPSPARLSAPATQSDHTTSTMASPSSPPLFSIPIPPCGASHSGGAIVCTAPHPGVFALTWRSPPDNRQTTSFLRAMLTALDTLEFGPAAAGGGVVVTTSAIPKFYSNGLDLAHAVATEGFWSLLYQVWRRLLTYAPFCSRSLLVCGRAHA